MIKFQTANGTRIEVECNVANQEGLKEYLHNYLLSMRWGQWTLPFDNAQTERLEEELKTKIEIWCNER